MKHAAVGFTLVEMMMTIAILAILLALAVPSFQESALASRLRASSTDLMASANVARSEAIKRRAPVNMCVSTNGATCGSGRWHEGWIVFAPATASAPAAVIRKFGPSAGGLRINASNSIATVAFQPTGAGATPVTFTVCRATPQAGAQERIVTIDATGRATSRRTQTGACN